ncbi:hypothetical protein DFH08DRAFT_623667, partial [Mycena albidolilacea]
GPCFKELMATIVAFEESTMWEGCVLPSSNMRPVEIGQWMKEHRKPGDNNKLEPDFGPRLMAWWINIGPEFRKGERPAGYPEDEQWPPQSTEGRDPKEFECLRRTGQNGILLVVLALTWW